MLSRTSHHLIGFSFAAAAAGTGVYFDVQALGVGLALSVLFLLAKRHSTREGFQRAALGWQALLAAAFCYGMSEFHPAGLVWGGLFVLFGTFLLATEPTFYGRPHPTD
jgi:hypothetical protein